MDALKLIRQIKFFDHYSNEDILMIRPFIEIKHFSAQNKILDHDIVNTSLYFLLKGEVDVFSHREYLTTINQMGELFGEMSISGHTSSRAKIISKTQTTFLVFNFLAINDFPLVQREHLEKLMYKSFSEVLAERLNKTNTLLEKVPADFRKAA